MIWTLGLEFPHPIDIFLVGIHPAFDDIVDLDGLASFARFVNGLANRFGSKALFGIDLHIAACAEQKWGSRTLSPFPVEDHQLFHPCPVQIFPPTSPLL